MKQDRRKTSDEPSPQVMAGFTAPMRLVDHLHRPKMKLDLVPVLDLFTIGLLISLLFTRFVMVPGVRIDLPDSEMRMPHHDSLVAVLTIGNNGMLYFDGSVYEQSSIKRAFNQHIESRKPDLKSPVLFVKAEGSMPLQSLLELCAMAQAAGFQQVQIAGEKEQAPEDLVPADALRGSQQFTPSVL